VPKKVFFRMQVQLMPQSPQLQFYEDKIMAASMAILYKAIPPVLQEQPFTYDTIRPASNIDLGKAVSCPTGSSFGTFVKPASNGLEWFAVACYAGSTASYFTSCYGGHPYGWVNGVVETAALGTWWVIVQCFDIPISLISLKTALVHQVAS
jgi:hypothetical protein